MHVNLSNQIKIHTLKFDFKILEAKNTHAKNKNQINFLSINLYIYNSFFYHVYVFLANCKGKRNDKQRLHETFDYRANTDGRTVNLGCRNLIWSAWARGCAAAAARRAALARSSKTPRVARLTRYRDTSVVGSTQTENPLGVIAFGPGNSSTHLIIA